MKDNQGEKGEIKCMMVVYSLILWELNCLQCELPVSMSDYTGRKRGNKKAVELENVLVPSIFIREPYLTHIDANQFFIHYNLLAKISIFI